jgi:endonuclease-3
VCYQRHECKLLGTLFASFRQAIEQEGVVLPSVSIIAEREQDPYRVVKATIMSVRTKDEVTLAASKRLFALAKDPHSMLDLSPSQIEEAIYPAGFYKTKAKTIQEISRQLIERFGGKVPDTQAELLTLPGLASRQRISRSTSGSRSRPSV